MMCDDDAVRVVLKDAKTNKEKNEKDETNWYSLSAQIAWDENGWRHFY